MTIAPLPQGFQQFIGPNGQVLSSGSITNYYPRTSAFKGFWADPAQATPHANPTVLSVAGITTMYGWGAYRQVVLAANGDTISDSVTWGGGPRQSAIVLNLGENGVFTVPPGVYMLYVEAVGAGGAGSNCTAAVAVGDVAGAGGGAGGFANGLYAVTPNQAISYSIGVGGAVGSQASGGGTSFGSVIFCTGGKGANFSTQGTSTGGAGGTAAGGTIMNITGGAGTDGSHIPIGGGGAPYNGSGNGGNSFYGQGGTAANGADGNSGIAAGSGGGGAMDVNLSGVTFNGGAGNDGQLIISYWS